MEFLALVDKAVPEELEMHLVLDSYSKHKTAVIHNWLERRPRFHLRFTPTSASWIYRVERWFAEITRQRIRRATFPSAMERAIKEYLGLQRGSPAVHPDEECWSNAGITSELLYAYS